MQKKNYPILPLPIALEAIEELKGFVSSLLYSRNAATREAILKCLFEEDPMIKGPFLDIRMPYKSSNENWSLDERLKPLAYKHGPPYIHQFKSFRQLQFKNAINTIVTTGTGSGKSECFSFPMFDYVLDCKKNDKLKGVKALILYPMNALIDDQGERITQIANNLNSQLEPSLQIRVGRYTGSDGQNKLMDHKNEKQIIDDRQSLIENPPDILLTNYRMLDFMLMRPEEQSFWLGDTQDVFKYIVIDEIHTFDGAQGADVAALLRRLKLKLGLEKITCVGTSATIAASGAGNDPLKDLCNFATTLFGENFFPEHVITNESMSLTETFDQITPLESNSNFVNDAFLNSTYKNSFLTLAKKWNAPSDVSQLSNWVAKEKKYSSLLNSNIKKGETLKTLSEKSGLDKVEVLELLTLLSFAKNNSGKMALIPQNTQIWAQGTKYLFRKLSNDLEFIRAESMHKLKSQDDIYLPSISCRACGASGWLTHLKQDSFTKSKLPAYSLTVGSAEIMRRFQNKEAQILFNVHTENENPTYYYRPDLQRIWHVNDISHPEDAIPVHVAHQDANRGISIRTNGEVIENCPECDTKLSLSLGLMGTSMLGSVLTGQFLASQYNPSDKKFLIFNDSVQDAHHQAGYLSARGYRFNTRRFIYKLLKDILKADATISLTELQKQVKGHLENLWDQSLKGDAEASRTAKSVLVQLLPKDLWERWNSEKRAHFLKDAKGKSEFLDRLLWESWMEMTIQSDLGWSLRKTALVLLEPSKDILNAWTKALENIEIQSPALKVDNKESYVYGMLRKIILQGGLQNEEFKDIYNTSNFSKWPYLRYRPHLQSVLVYNYPRLITLNNTAADGYIRVASSKGTTWFKKWGEKHGLTPQGTERLNSMLFDQLRGSNCGLIRIENSNDTVFALDPAQFFISRDHAILKRCESCAYLSAQDEIFKDLTTNCFQMRCSGHLQSEIDESSIAAEQKYRGYMKSHYEKDLISPLAHPHTGQLKGDDRRLVEDAFKKSLLPGDKLSEGSNKLYKDQPINVLTCTPTMEMGIDIGTLSGVALRSFPPSQASAIQRLGRSGRSSGNAYNLILFKDRPHDQTYWENPDLYFSGSVKTPGCEFRNTQLLLRQFNAYLVDSFSKLNPDLRIPKVNDLEKTNLKKTPYWSSLIKFLKLHNTKIVKDFVKSVLDDSTQIKESDLESFLVEKWRSNNLVDELELILSALSNDTSEEVVIKDPEDPENAVAEVQQQTRSFNKKRDRNEDTYILKILADKGLLPNYAFPDKGVTLQYELYLETNSTNEKENNRWISKTIERPPKSGLSDLALGQYYYADGFKVQINRAEMPKDGKIPRRILCDDCGILTPLPHKIEAKVHDCPFCAAADQRVIEVLDYKYVYASDRFEKSLINDNDDEREKKSMVVETFFENDDKSGTHVTWLSDEARIGFDFAIDQKIVHLNRNFQFGQTPMYFHVCPSCLALPYREDRDSQKHIFKDHREFNRHGLACKYRLIPNDLSTNELKTILLSRKLTSDVIRVVAPNLETVPTLKATLRFAMKLYLKGEAQHLHVENSILNNPDGSQVHLITLYDNVAGGTGNLRSLMQLSHQNVSNKNEGFKKLSEIFERTLTALTNCECTNGCYKCLFSFDNQFDHKKIFKAKAVSWLKRFIEATDWRTEENLINVQVGSDSQFGSQLEDKFVEKIRSNKMSYIDRVVESKEDGEQLFQIVTSGLTKAKVALIPRADKMIPIEGAIPYTKPDFVLYNSGQIASYIYVDGAEFHLNPSSDKSTFEKVDIYTRPALLDRLNSESKLEIKKVLTITTDMLNCLGEPFKANTDAHDLIQTIIQLFVHDTEPVFTLTEVAATITRFANQSMQELITQESLYWKASDQALYKRLIEQVSVNFKDQRFGGLRFDKVEKRFKMSVRKNFRQDNNSVNKNYQLSWNLYWILFYINPNLIEIED